ncbi:MAG: hypothetical protein J6S67_21005 [Methanobrevibacter sp.]|nr:hypothetical protein [Methanobrevibacter sp.]
MKTEEKIKEEIKLIKAEIEIFKKQYEKQSCFSTAVCVNDNKIWLEALEWVLEDN